MRAGPLRDCQAWKDEGLSISTGSNEAAKLYDSCLSQYVGWYDDTQTGGLEKTLEKMLDADSSFVLGKALSLGLSLLGTSDTIHSSPALKSEYDFLQKFRQDNLQSLSERETLHLKAVTQWAEGKTTAACKTWEDLLLSYPTDIHALKMSHDSYFFMGALPQLRDSVARVLPVWEEKRPPLKSYLYGFYAFGLEENNQFAKAEFYGRKGLEENRFDGWSTHSLAHVFEMEGRTKEGISFMSSTLNDWEKCNLLACHNHWHVGLYHIENEEYDVASEILDKHLLSKALNSKAVLDIVDCSSLLWRLKMLSPSSLREWQTERALSLTKDFSKGPHVTTFNDIHFMMTYASDSSKNNDSLVNDLLETYPGWSKEDIVVGDLCNHPTIGRKLLQAFADFRDEKYSKVVETLEPIRRIITGIGGSNAQRDVFNLMLLVSALRSSSKRDMKLAKVLINEREAFKGKSTLLSERMKAICDA